jgi:hypothetical protein
MLPVPVRPDHHPTRDEQSVKPAIKDRHLYGVGAAPCAVCCAAPIVGVLGLAGAAAAAVSFAFAGLAFAVVVAGTGLALTLARRRTERAQRCSPAEDGPVDVTILPPR